MVPCSVVELRQYTLHPGQRDTLVTLFERELIESQEAAGIRVLGQFEDLDRPDRFVWFRGFAGMAGRHAALTAFYGGPVWAEHRAAEIHRVPGAKDLRDFCLEHVEPALEGTGAPVIAWLETHDERNDYPRLPVREDADVVVCVSVLPDEGALRRHLALLAADLAWAEEVVPGLRRRVARDPEQLVLCATPRSALF